ncbi:MAG: transcription-repair coupling factor, partial [Verrucomicrobiota bacterium]
MAEAPPIRRVTGVCPPARGAVLAALTQRERAPVWLVVTPTLREAELLAEDTAFFHRALGSPAPLAALVFPESVQETAEMREAFAASSDRLAVLSRLRAVRGLAATPDSLVVATTPAALLQPVPALEEFARRELTLTRGATLPFQALLEELRRLDYDCEAVCEAPGHYAVRGGLVDIYPVTASGPLRIDFFGDEIEAIRRFDPVTQRSGDAVETVTVPASPRVRLATSVTGLVGYLPGTTRLVLVEPATLEAELAALRPAGGADPLAALAAHCAGVSGLGDLDEASGLLAGAAEEVTWNTEALSHHRRTPGEGLIAQERLSAEEEARGEFLALVASWGRAGAEVAVVMSKEGEEQRAKELLAAAPGWKELRPRWWRGALTEGYRLTARADAALALPAVGGGRRQGQR